MSLTLFDLSLLLATGLGAGFLAGLLGVGGGLIIVPILISWLIHKGQYEHHAHIAIATSLVVMIPTALASVRAHWYKNAIESQFALFLTPGLLVGSVIGALFALSLDGLILVRFFTLFVFSAALQLAFGRRSSESINSMASYKDSLTGSIIGAISAIVGIGGGSMTVPWLIHRGINTTRAVATSSIGTLTIAIASATTYLIIPWAQNQESLIDWQVVALIAVPATLIAPFGAYVAHKVPADKLRKIFALFLFIVAIKLSFSAF